MEGRVHRQVTEMVVLEVLVEMVEEQQDCV